MSIQDDDQEIIRVPGFWSLLFKLALMAAIPFSGSVMLGGVWVVRSIFEHDSRIRVLEDRSTSRRAENTNTNIITSDASKMASSTSGKGYLTTADVAEREKCDPRTIINYIDEGRIIPPPEKRGKEWVISDKYRIIPKNSEIVRIEGGELASP